MCKDLVLSLLAEEERVNDKALDVSAQILDQPVVSDVYVDHSCCQNSY